jgi:hypothetical protein
MIALRSMFLTNADWGLIDMLKSRAGLFRNVGKIAVAAFIATAGGPWARSADLVVTTLTPNEQAIIRFAGSSKCAKYSWSGNQGVAPIGYTKGVALLFRKSFCEHIGERQTAVVEMRRPLGSSTEDALRFYQDFADIDAGTPLKRIEAVYTLALSMGMQESSGWPGAHYDKDGNPNPTVLTAEAGLFQTSYNTLESTHQNPALVQLYQSYSADRSRCRYEVFSQGTSKEISEPIGEGPGADFQQLMKTCPAFATEYVMVMLRIQRSHYGTLGAGPKKAEFEQTCLAMFREIATRTRCQN